MDTQWVLLAIAALLIALAVTTLVAPNRLVRGNLTWAACSWLAGELAPWLAFAAFTVGLLVATTGKLDDGPGRLAAMLAVVAGLGLSATAHRARAAARALDSSLRDGLGAGYLGEVPRQRLAALADPRSSRSRLGPVPHRPSAVELIADLPYPGGHERNVLDVYRPAAGCRGAPVLLQLHGGGWTRGKKGQQALPLVHHLAALGWVVITPNYRLGPDARMPAALVDCKAAFAWARAHVAAMGGDPSFIAVTGGGAGAHLAALLALTFDEQELQPGFEHVDTRPAACVPLHGIYDLTDRRRRQPGHQARLRWLGENLMPSPLVGEAAAWDAASPLTLARRDAPPFFVLHGTHDTLCHVEEAREFVRELRRASTSPVAYAELDGAQHGWDTLCSPRALHTVRAVTHFLEWCVARHRAGRLAGTPVR